MTQHNQAEAQLRNQPPLALYCAPLVNRNTCFFMPLKNRTFVCVITLLCLPVVFFWRAMLGWLTLGHRDLVGQLFPLQHFAFAQWRAGAWPLWNPYQYGGMPLLAHLQAGVLDPLNSLYLFSVSSFTVTLTQQATFALALIGMFVFTRSLGLQRRACLVAAVVYGLSGFPVSRSVYGAFLHALAWLPWVLWAVERLRQSGQWRYVAWGGLVVACQSFAGHPQIFAYSILLVLAYAFLAGRSTRRFAGQFLVMLASGCVAAAVQWLPAWEAARAAARQDAGYDFYISNSLHPLTLLTTLFPFFHGDGSAPYHVPFWGETWSHNESQFYLGVLALALACAAITRLWREPSGQIKFWSVVTILALCCALGGYLPPLAAVLARVPLLNGFRSPNRHWLEILTACSVLVGFAVNALLEENAVALRRTVWRWALAWSAVCGAIALCVLSGRGRAEAFLRLWPGWGALPKGILQAAGPEFYVPVLIAAAATATLWFFLRQPASRWRYALLLGVWLVDYYAYAACAPIYNTPHLEATLGQAFPTELADNGFRSHVLLPPQQGEFVPYWFAGHEMLTGYDPLLSRRFLNFTGINQVGRSERHDMLAANDHTLNLLNVRYLLIPTAPQLDLATFTPDAARWQPVPLASAPTTYGGWRVFENQRALPRAWLVSQIKALPAAEQLAFIRGAADFDPRQTALLEPGAAAQLAATLPNAQASANSEPRFIERNATRIVLEATAEKSALLVLSEIYSPGWTAEVDGRATQVWRTNYCLRGVALPAGQHRVTLRYAPVSWRWGKWLSLLGCLSLVFFGWLDFRQRGKKQLDEWWGKLAPFPSWREAGNALASHLFSTPRAYATWLIVLTPIVFFWSAVRGQSLLAMGDSWVYSLPMRMLVGAYVRTGTLPLWNPHTFGGLPFLATIQPGALYPPNWVFAFLPPVAAMNFVVITSYHIALAGTYRFVRSLQLDRLPALAAALIFTFGGFFLPHLEDTNYIAAVAWLPWILLALERLAQRFTWRWLALGAAFIALQCFGGLPQGVWQTMLVAVPYALFLFVRQATPAARWRWAVTLGALGLFGFLLSAMQLLPTIELQRQGDRAHIDYDTFSTFSMPLRRVLSFAFPYFFGGGHTPLYHVPGWDEWWLLKMAYAYVGFVGWLLSLYAVLTGWRNRAVLFWVALSLGAFIMMFGSHLPFGLNHLFYAIPVHNLFRGPYRHSLELTFALAVLTAYGWQALAHAEAARRHAQAWLSIALVAAFAIFTTVVYLFFPDRLGAIFPPPPGGNSLRNPEAFVPLLCCALSCAALWLAARRPQQRHFQLCLLAVLLLDLALFGQFTQWGSTSASVITRLDDSPAIQFIKAREPVAHAYRLANMSDWPFGVSSEAINHANFANPRGVQNVTGYDPMRPARSAAVIGAMNIFGGMNDTTALGMEHQGLNLYNVKYLLRERRGEITNSTNYLIEHQGIKFLFESLYLALQPGVRREYDTGHAPATEIALVSALSNSGHIKDGTTVARVVLKTTEGQLIEREIKAGRDTSEWAYDRADVKSSVQHARATIAENFASPDFQGHHYLARITFDRARIATVAFEYLLPSASLAVTRASLYDATERRSYALDSPSLPTERWRQLAYFAPVDVFENVQAQPRAWFVPRLVIQPEAEILRSIQTGKLSDGTPFDPATTALLEQEAFAGRALPTTGDIAQAQVSVERYAPQRITLQTSNPQPGFLVLSETYYRGWAAYVDGQRVPMRRVNYAMRGVALPAGTHRVEFRYLAPTFWRGAALGALGIALLAGGAAFSRFKKSPSSQWAFSLWQKLRANNPTMPTFRR